MEMELGLGQPGDEPLHVNLRADRPPGGGRDQALHDPLMQQACRPAAPDSTPPPSPRQPTPPPELSPTQLPANPYGNSPTPTPPAHTQLSPKGLLGNHTGNSPTPTPRQHPTVAKAVAGQPHRQQFDDDTPARTQLSPERLPANRAGDSSTTTRPPPPHRGRNGWEPTRTATATRTATVRRQLTGPHPTVARTAASQPGR